MTDTAIHRAAFPAYFQDPTATGRCARRECNQPIIPWLDREFCSRTCRAWRWAPLGQRLQPRADLTMPPLTNPWHGHGDGGC